VEQLRGWHPDPFGRHEQRYFSRGDPTYLVRDGGVESQDEPTGASAAASPTLRREEASTAPPSSEHGNESLRQLDGTITWSQPATAPVSSSGSDVVAAPTENLSLTSPRHRSVASRTVLVTGAAAILGVGLGATYAAAHIFPHSAGRAIGTTIAYVIAIPILLILFLVFAGGSAMRTDKLAKKTCPLCGHRGFIPARSLGGIVIAGIFAPKSWAKCRNCGFRMRGLD
jgi:hypothetical protein